MENYHWTFILYFISMLLSAGFVYSEDDTETLSDFLRSWWVFLLPGINSFVAGFFIGKLLIRICEKIGNIKIK